MKKLLSFSLIVLSLTMHTQASEYIDSLKNLTWGELQANYDVDFEGDQIMFGGNIVSRLDTCLSDDKTLRTISKREIQEYDGDDFYVVGYDYLYTSLSYYKTYSDGDGTIDVLKTHKINKLINVVQADDDFEGSFLFEKTHTLEACAE